VRREFAWVPRGYDRSKVVHRTGLPTEPSHSDRVLPSAALVILHQAEAPDKGFFLFRYSGAGDDAGDTWHQSVDDAKHQTDFEFGTLTWEPVEEKTPDRAFAIAKLAQRTTS
jgi:hypothetical protein